MQGAYPTKNEEGQAVMFKGVFEHQLDDKNRIRIPSKFKKELTGENGERTYSFFRGMNNCICVMADEELDDAIASISEEGISESNQASAMFFSSIFSAEEDAQGRVVIPSMLKRIAGIQKEIVTIGRGKRLEIWAAEKYYDYINGVDYDAELKKLGI
jgi:MraZ protein